MSLFNQISPTNYLIWRHISEYQHWYCNHRKRNKCSNTHLHQLEFVKYQLQAKMVNLSVLLVTIPASCETSIKKAKSAAQKPVEMVPLTGTCVRWFTSEKNEGNKPSLAIAIRIRGCKNEISIFTFYEDFIVISTDLTFDSLIVYLRENGAH